MWASRSFCLAKVPIKQKTKRQKNRPCVFAFKQHEKAKREGNIDLTEQDFLNIPDYIDSYDDILEVRTFRSGDREVVLGKKINGYSVIVELMSNNRKSLHFKNMWGLDTPTYESRYGKRSTASHPDRSSVSANDPTEVYHGTSSVDSIPQVAPGVNLKGRGLDIAVAEGTKRALEEMARAEQAERFRKESKPLRERLIQIQAEGEAGLAKTRASYEKAVAERKPEITKIKDDGAVGLEKIEDHRGGMRSTKETFTGDSKSAIIKKDKAQGTISMPNYEKAITPAEKFTQYSLNYENKKAAGKPEAYERGLGYTQENAGGLIDQIHKAVVSGTAQAFEVQITQYGIKYKYRIAVTGPNGKTKNVIAVYQIDSGSETPRMITNYLEGK